MNDSTAAALAVREACARLLEDRAVWFRREADALLDRYHASHGYQAFLEDAHRRQARLLEAFAAEIRALDVAAVLAQS